MRKHYIDNLRNLTILLLFPVHTFMIWNNFGSKFYIWQGENKLLSALIVLVNPWFMPILFALAGLRHSCGAGVWHMRGKLRVDNFCVSCHSASSNCPGDGWNQKDGKVTGLRIA